MDGQTMAIITAVGGTCAALGKYIKSLHTTTVRKLEKQNEQLQSRASECEEDRKNLHGRLNDQSERITSISQKLGRLEGRLTRDENANADK